MKQLSKTLFVSIVAIGFAATTVATEPAQLTEQSLKATDMRGGFVLHLGCGDGVLTAFLAAHECYVVHGMDGARPDVLVSDGKYVYLQQIKFGRELNRQEELGRHLMTNSGLTDDTWFYRTFWRLGYGDVHDFPFSYIKHALQVPFGQLLVFDSKTVCGLQTFMSPGIVPSGAAPASRGCLLFADSNQPFTPDKKTSPATDDPENVTRPKTPVDHRWTVKVPFQARAMLLASNALFVSGWPDDGAPADLDAARAGDKAGHLWVFSPDTGQKIAERELESGPVFDGMAAAGERLFVSLKNGKVVCFGEMD